MIGNYFSSPKDNHEFIKSGCCLLDCVLGGGWPIGRISNVIGDKSTSKTGLSIEAIANFAKQYPEGRIFYRESESAFDLSYAASMGMPVERVELAPKGSLFTVEDFFEDLTAVSAELEKEKVPGLYVLDSLDALSDREELSREIDKGSYGALKAKRLSELFRRLVQKVASSRLALIIVSQVRDNIGVSFGANYIRSGGRALDFYASVVVYLAKIKSNERTINNVKRITGISVRVKCTKNKVSLPMRECDFDYEFGFGVNDLKASFDWLKAIKRLDILGLSDEKELKKLVSEVNQLSNEAYEKYILDINEKVTKVWFEIETDFLPARRKYS